MGEGDRCPFRAGASRGRYEAVYAEKLTLDANEVREWERADILIRQRSIRDRLDRHLSPSLAASA
jgi:hypothetical protein